MRPALNLICLLILSLGVPSIGVCAESVSPLTAADQRCQALYGMSGQNLVSKFLTGARVHRPEGSVMEVDGRTLADLEVMGATLPHLKKFALTSFGAKHLEWQVQHPSLDPEDIRQRQRAVQALIHNPQLRERVQKLLDEIQYREQGRGFLFEQRSSYILDKMNKFNGPLHPFFKWLGRVLDYGVLVGGYGLTLYGYLSQEVLSLLPVMFFGAHNYRFQTDRRRDLATFKSLFKAAHRLADDLSESDSAYLQQLGGVLNAVKDRRHPLEIKSTSDYVRRLIASPELIARFLDMIMISNLTMPRHDAKVRRELYKIAVIGSALAELEMYFILSEYGKTPGMVFPEALDRDAPFTLSIEEGHYPHLFASDKGSVPNPVSFDLTSADEQRVQGLFLTGPNNRGKSVYIRMAGTLVLIAQLGGPVPAKGMRFTPMGLLSHIENPDSTVERQSSFVAQSTRMAKLIQQAGQYSHALFLMDEILTGTSIEEQLAAEEAILRWLISKGHFVLVASHKRQLTRLAGEVPGFRNIHVSDSDDSDRRYRIEQGPSQRRNAFEVMRETGLPPDLVDLAQEIFRKNQYYKLLK